MNKMKRFEGEDVDGGFDILIRQFRGDIEVPLALEEVVDLKVTAKVMEVTHQLSKKTGIITRTHIVHVIDVEVET